MEGAVPAAPGFATGVSGRDVQFTPILSRRDFSPQELRILDEGFRGRTKHETREGMRLFMSEYLMLKDGVCRKLDAVTFPQAIGHAALLGLFGPLAMADELARLLRFVDVVKEAVLSAEGGFFECSCGRHDDTADLDFVIDLRAALRGENVGTPILDAARARGEEPDFSGPRTSLDRVLMIRSRMKGAKVA